MLGCGSAGKFVITC